MRLSRQLAEDRALRDAALALFKADLRFIRNDLDQRGLGERMADRIGDSAKEFVDEAIDYAGNHKSVVTAAVAAVVLWFARAPILHAIGDLFEDDREEPEPERKPRRSSRRGKTSAEVARERQEAPKDQG
jgi:hypothetical protein